MRKSFFTIAAAILFFGSLLTSFFVHTESAEAIPAFARKYNMSCTTCHAPIPRLKAYGDEFAGNGFVLKDKDATRYFVETGDEHLSLIRDFPVAVRIDGFIKYDSETDRDVDLAAPYLVKFLSGGSLAKNLAYYFYFYMNERGEVAGVEDAYLMFNDLFGKDLDLYLGQFQVSDPLFKRELRLTYEDYQIYKHAPGESNIALAYDRGMMITLGLESGTDIIVEILNGNGLSAADDSKVYDSDQFKCFAGRISQDINDNIRLGGFGYYGKEAQDNFENEVWMAGPDLTLSYNDIAELNVQYMERRDTDPDFVGNTEDVESRGGHAELIILPDGDRSRYYGVLLGNYVESFEGTWKYKSIAAHAGYLLRTNLRLTGEIIYDVEAEETKALIGFTMGL